ncbi:MAG TPA: hypothetical protein VFC19_23825 [Candidatus Limnocylindrales bacterium]|nr:hypothetical protein [Candidatus Limnocylindrales bacterium]
MILVRATVEPTLNGGSFCQVRLRQSGELVVVGKTSEDMLAGDPDAGLRLTREVTWLRGLSRSAGALFAPLLATQANGLGYTARFLHSYTLSERLFHGTLDADAAVAMLGETLSSLRRDLYGMPCKAAAEDTYSDKLTRRLHRLTSASGDATMLKELMACERLVINGTECLGLPGLIASGLERRLDRLNGLLPREQAHGDLILDDIVCPRQDRCYLVDPSGTGSSRVYDVGKLGLSLCSYYEFFKYDRFTIDRDLSTSIPSINITIGMDEVRRTYDQIAMALPTLLRDTGVFDARNCLSGEDFLLLNGAQNLALPMFHSLRHHKHERALAFMTMGILRLNQYLNMMNRAVPTTLDTVIDNLGAELALVG